MFQGFLARIQSLLLAVLSLFGVINNESDYAKQLNDSGIFDNHYEESIAQKDIRSLIDAHFNDENTNGKVKKCLIVGYDGARAESCLVAVPDDSGVLYLKEQGGLYLAYTGGDFPMYQDSSTAPGWATLLTGAWSNGLDGHGVTANSVIKPNRRMTVMTDLAAAGKINSSAFYVSWGGHFQSDLATYKKEIAYTAERGYNMKWETLSGDDTVYAATLADLQNPDGSDFVMAILEHCDSTGHGSGYGNQNEAYVKGFQTGDSMALSLIKAIEARDTYADEDWLILITSDHGGIRQGHGSISSYEREIFFATNKAWSVAE